MVRRHRRTHGRNQRLARQVPVDADRHGARDSESYRLSRHTDARHLAGREEVVVLGACSYRRATASEHAQFQVPSPIQNSIDELRYGNPSAYDALPWLCHQSPPPPPTATTRHVNQDPHPAFLHAHPTNTHQVFNVVNGITGLALICVGYSWDERAAGTRPSHTSAHSKPPHTNSAEDSPRRSPQTTRTRTRTPHSHPMYPPCPPYPPVLMLVACFTVVCVVFGDASLSDTEFALRVVFLPIVCLYVLALMTYEQGALATDTARVSYASHHHHRRRHCVVVMVQSPATHPPYITTPHQPPALDGLGHRHLYGAIVDKRRGIPEHNGQRRR